MTLKTKVVAALVPLAVLDMVVPIPFTALLLLYVVLEKPSWFKKLTNDLYTT